MIELQGVTKLYGTVIGINDITMSLPPGAYGLVGPNGSGKTTLLNLITGQLRPTMGRVRVFEQAPWNRDEMLRRIGLCPSVDILYSHVSALRWVTYLVELHGFRRSDARRRAINALQQVGLKNAMRRPLGTYSLGMRQRAKLAQAIAHDSDLLILDEPFNGLDPIGRHEMTELLCAWVGSGRSLILASHILYEVEAISPSFLLIRGGRLLASGTAQEVQTLLAEVPNAIRIRCNRPHRLARQLLDANLVESISFEEGESTLVVATRNPLEIYQQLPGWLQQLDIRVDEFRSTQESLQNLFTSLMRMHRGEKL